MSIGALVALIGLVLTVVFWAIHTLPEMVAALFFLAFAAILLGAVTTTWPWQRH